MEIKCLATMNCDVLCSAWQRAFVDYGMSASQVQLLAMFKRRGYLPEISFGAFYNNELVSMTLNGFGNYNGLTSVYDTSTGTAPEHRRQGLAKRIFLKSLECLKRYGAEQYILEVLKQNEAAVVLYQGLGFSKVREFFYFRGQTPQISQAVHTKIKPLPKRYHLVDMISLPDEEEISNMWDFAPSWQNSVESVHRKYCALHSVQHGLASFHIAETIQFPLHCFCNQTGSIETLKIIGVFESSEDDSDSSPPRLVGYGIVEPSTGDIPQIAVAPTHRRQGLALHLFSRLLDCLTETETVKVINVEVNCTSLIAFLEEFCIPNSGGQYEMCLDFRHTNCSYTS